MNIAPYFFLTMWSVFIAVTTLIWNLSSNTPPGGDPSYYLFGTQQLVNSIGTDNLWDVLIKSTEITSRKAPLLSYLAVPFFLIFGSSNLSSVLVNIAFVFLFSFSFYKLVGLFYSKRVALSAVVITSTFPLFYGLNRVFFVEFGLMVLVIIWIYFLVKTKYLLDKKNLIYLGIVTGLGFLMKSTFFLFIAGPAIFYFIKCFKSQIFPKKFIHLVYAFIPALLIVAPWYSKNLLTVLWHAKRSTSPSLLGDYYYGNPLSVEVVSKYLGELVNFGISGYWFLAVVLIVIFNVLKGPIKVNWLLFSWFLIPFVVFLLGTNKDYRLILPILPPVAIFISCYLNSIFNKKVKYVFPLIVVFPTMLLLNTTIIPTRLFKNSIKIGGVLLADSHIGQYSYPPNSTNWMTEEIVIFISKLPTDKSTKTIVLATDHPFFRIENIKFYVEKNQLPMNVLTISHFYRNGKMKDIQEMVESGDYLIMKYGGEVDFERINEVNKQIIVSSSWSQIKNPYIFPDSGKLLIFKNPQ